MKYTDNAAYEHAQ